MLGVSTEDFKGGHIVTARVVCLVRMPNDGVTAGDNQVVEGARPSTGVVSGKCESSDNLPVVEVAGEVEGEFFDLVEGCQEALGSGRATQADEEIDSFRGAVLKGPLLLLV